MTQQSLKKLQWRQARQEIADLMNFGYFAIATVLEAIRLHYFVASLNQPLNPLWQSQLHHHYLASWL